MHTQFTKKKKKKNQTQEALEVVKANIVQTATYEGDGVRQASTQVAQTTI